jgi:hypothetical protein
MPDTVQKSFQPLNKDVKYLNRDFNSFKQGLMDFAKNYYPKSYQDFSDASPGTMFIEQAAYVGDVLSYYIDYQFKESLLPYSQERKNVLTLAKYLGYKPSPTTAATAEIEIFQLVPSKLDSDNNYVPDEKYCLSLKQYMQLENTNGQKYIINESLDFSTDTKFSPREVTVYSRDSLGIPQFFLLRKTAKAFSGEILTKTVSVGSPEPFFKIEFTETNVLEIIDVVDSNNNKWYEVDYLAQDVIFTEVDNVETNDGTFYVYKTDVPKIMKSLKTSRKFTKNITSTNTTYLEFGANIDNGSDEIVYPNSNVIGIGLSNISNIDISLDSNNFLKTNTYGIAPSNTTLTINYIVGGGLSSNSGVNEIIRVNSYELYNDVESFNPVERNLFDTILQTLRVNNYTPATGGKDAEGIDELRQNAIAMFASQNRVVTKDDYVVRAISMPSRFGTVAKAYVKSDVDLNFNLQKNVSGFVDNSNNATGVTNDIENYFRKINYDISNPFSINLYVLSYDSNKNLSKINDALIFNLRHYLSKYKLLTDGINIIDGYIINIGINYKISVYNNYNKREVLNSCDTKIKEFFDIDKWGFSQPINISQLELEIAKVEGVQSVAQLEIYNLTAENGNYSPHQYDINAATKNKMIYPSLDPCIFEVKYPETDIKGSVM